MSFLSKLADASSGKSALGRPLSGLLVELPALYEYLAAGSYPDGSARDRSTCTIFVEDGCIKVCLSDRDQSRTLWRAAESVEMALLEVESALTGGTADWRRSGGVPKGAGRNGKKS